jgi:hypothetical protein
VVERVGDDDGAVKRDGEPLRAIELTLLGALAANAVAAREPLVVAVA